MTDADSPTKSKITVDTRITGKTIREVSGVLTASNTATNQSAPRNVDTSLGKNSTGLCFNAFRLPAKTELRPLSFETLILFTLLLRYRSPRIKEERSRQVQFRGNHFPEIILSESKYSESFVRLSCCTTSKMVERLIRRHTHCFTMASMWDIGKSSKEKLADSWEDEGVLEEKVEKHRDKFEDEFKNNMNKEVPTHPYKIYRNIVENKELDDEERIALEQMKDEFSEEWQRLKQTHSN